MPSGNWRVLSLWRYPVKSLLGEELTESALGPEGLAGDRAWGVRERASGRILSAKRWDGLFAFSARYPDGPKGEPVVLTPAGEALGSSRAAEALSESLGTAVELVRFSLESGAVYDYGAPRPAPPGPFFDADPVHVMTAACLAALRAEFPAGDFDPGRFRPNLLVEGGGDEDILGRELAFPRGLRLAARKRTSRCVMTTLAQAGLPKEPGILRTVARTMAGKAGVYARVSAPGRARAGDEFRLEG